MNTDIEGTDAVNDDGYRSLSEMAVDHLNQAGRHVDNWWDVVSPYVLTGELNLFSYQRIGDGITFRFTGDGGAIWYNGRKREWFFKPDKTPKPKAVKSPPASEQYKSMVGPPRPIVRTDTITGEITQTIPAQATKKKGKSTDKDTVDLDPDRHVPPSEREVNEEQRPYELDNPQLKESAGEMLKDIVGERVEEKKKKENKIDW